VGAGSQLVSFSLPGEFAPAYSVKEPSGLVCKFRFLVPSEYRFSGFGWKK